MHLLAVVIELRGVLQAQHHRVLGHALDAGLPVRLHHVLPGECIVAQEAVGRNRLRPIAAGVGNARRRLGCQAFSQQHRPLVQACIAQIQGFKFFCGPALVYNEMGLSREKFDKCFLFDSF